MPTLMTIINPDWKPAKEKPMDGLDIRPLLYGDTAMKTPHDALYFYWGNQLQAVRVGDWKLHFPHEYQSIEGRTGAKNGKPNGYVKKHTGVELYNLREDIGETRNRAETEEAVVELIKQKADRIRAELGDTNTMQKGNAVRPPGMLPTEEQK